MGCRAACRPSVAAEEQVVDDQVGPVGYEVSPQDPHEDPRLAVPQDAGVPGWLGRQRGQLALRAELDLVGLAAALVRRPESVVVHLVPFMGELHPAHRDTSAGPEGIAPLPPGACRSY